jgi:hypothetical protein
MERFRRSIIGRLSARSGGSPEKLRRVLLDEGLEKTDLAATGGVSA